MRDRRRVDGNRAMKRGFSGGYVKASLRRALRQQVAPWPSVLTPKPQEPAQAVGEAIQPRSPT